MISWIDRILIFKYIYFMPLACILSVAMLSRAESTVDKMGGHRWMVRAREGQTQKRRVGLLHLGGQTSVYP